MKPDEYKPGEIKPEDMLFKVAAARMEDALASALNVVSSRPGATPEEISKVLKLIIKKEMILSFLLEEDTEEKPHKR